MTQRDGKGDVEPLPPPPEGYSICVVFPRLFEHVYAPLTAGLLSSVSDDAALPANADRRE